MAERIQPNSIVIGDSVSLIERIEPKSVHLSVFHPPLPGDKQGAERFTYFLYETFVETIIKQHKKILQPNGLLIIILPDLAYEKDSKRTVSPLSHAYKNFSQRGFHFFDRRIWNKEMPSSKQIKETPLQFDQFKFIQVYRHLPDWDVQPIYPQNEKRYNESTIWNIKADLSPEEFGQEIFPDKLADAIVNLYSRPDDTVLDVATGFGAIPAACQRNGRKWIGFEIQDEVGKIAQKRLANLGSRK